MEKRRLGRSGVEVSRIGLGTMTWGAATDEYEARDILAAFLDAGGTLIDTADVYAAGASESLVGKLLAEGGLRDSIVLATKAGMTPGTERGVNASRLHLLRSLDSALRRLRTDVIDLWQLHAWDPGTPIEETMVAAESAVKSGKARYIGVSNYSGWQLAKAGLVARAVDGLAPGLIATQHEYSLLERGIEREVAAAAADLGQGVLAWSPLGRGVLTGKYRTSTPAESRAADPNWARFVTALLDDRCGRVVDAVCTAAEGLDLHPAQLALAWVCDRPGVAAAIVGPRTAGQVRLALDASSTVLPDAIRVALDDVSAPAMGYPEGGRFQRW